MRAQPGRGISFRDTPGAPYLPGGKQARRAAVAECGRVVAHAIGLQGHAVQVDGLTSHRAESIPTRFGQVPGKSELNASVRIGSGAPGAYSSTRAAQTAPSRSIVSFAAPGSIASFNVDMAVVSSAATVGQGDKTVIAIPAAPAYTGLPRPSYHIPGDGHQCRPHYQRPQDFTDSGPPLRRSFKRVKFHAHKYRRPDLHRRAAAHPLPACASVSLPVTLPDWMRPCFGRQFMTPVRSRHHADGHCTRNPARIPRRARRT